LLVACFIVGDALALRMALASNKETMSSLMPLLKDCLILLRARPPCLRITRAIFYITTTHVTFYDIYIVSQTMVFLS
jgi:hypothetical protein